MTCPLCVQLKRGLLLACAVVERQAAGVKGCSGVCLDGSMPASWECALTDQSSLVLTPDGYQEAWPLAMSGQCTRVRRPVSLVWKIRSSFSHISGLGCSQ